MSHKAFYQTFFQTEQLFRRSDDGLTFPALTGEVSVRQTTELDVATSQPPDLILEEAPPVLITDPVVPQPVAVATVIADDMVTPVVAVDLETVTDTPALTPEPEFDLTTAEPTRQPPAIRRPATPLISQKVLILVDEDLLPSDLLFLEKILKAVHLDIAGVDLLNVHGTKQVNFAELLAGKYIHHFFTFGVPFSRLNLDIMMDRYQPVRFEGITFLMADPLPAIEGDVALKKKLWESLKKVFLWR